MNNHDFASVYAACKDNVWRLVSKYVLTREDREDLFQEVFLRVHQALPRFRAESAISTWVYKITVNTALNYVKRRNRYKWVKEIFNNLRVLEAEPQEPAANIEELRPLGKLNEQQRMILILADVEEKKLSEIAEMLDLPVGTVKSNLHRAREIIKKEVSEHGGV